MGALRRALKGRPRSTGAAPSPFAWPSGKAAAISLTFDDGRASQVDEGLPLFERHGVEATFFVVPSAVERRPDDWRRAVASGHEIGNHSIHHPCTGNFPWARERALEDYSLDDMRGELVGANDRIEAILGVVPQTFAYPCGQTFVGRGVDTRSYVPLVATHFLAGRGFRNEAPNDPGFCDLAQLSGIEMDGLDLDGILPLVEKAIDRGAWLVLAGHEIGADGPSTTRTSMLHQLFEWLGRDGRVWVAPMATVAHHVRRQRA